MENLKKVCISLRTVEVFDFVEKRIQQSSGLNVCRWFSLLRGISTLKRRSHMTTNLTVTKLVIRFHVFVVLSSVEEH